MRTHRWPTGSGGLQVDGLEEARLLFWAINQAQSSAILVNINKWSGIFWKYSFSCSIQGPTNVGPHFLLLFIKKGQNWVLWYQSSLAKFLWTINKPQTTFRLQRMNRIFKNTEKCSFRAPVAHKNAIFQCFWPEIWNLRVRNPFVQVFWVHSAAALAVKQEQHRSGEPIFPLEWTLLRRGHSIFDTPQFAHFS